MLVLLRLMMTMKVCGFICFFIVRKIAVPVSCDLYHFLINLCIKKTPSKVIQIVLVLYLVSS